MIASSSASVVGPAQNRAPSAVTTSSASMFSTVLPAITECAPHELLPIMPPSVQRLCVAGSGPKVSPCFSAAAFSASHTVPGWTSAVRPAGSTDTTLPMYLEKSSTTATLTHCPHCEVPPPRGSSGAPCSRQMRSAATTSSAVLGSTTPIGIWR